MSFKPMKPLPKKKQEVDLSKADTIKCKECENYLFISSFVIKRISALMSPTGQEALVPIQVYSCDGCSKVPSIFLKDIGMEEEIEGDPLFRPDLG